MCKHLANIIEAVCDDVRGAQVPSQAVFNGHVGVDQGDHGQVAVAALAVLRLVDRLEFFQRPETNRRDCHSSNSQMLPSSGRSGYVPCLTPICSSQSRSPPQWRKR